MAPAAEARALHAAVLVCTALAFAVRLGWVTLVEPPGGTVYSDMLGYVERARDLVTGTPSAVPSCYPFGTDWFYASEMLLFGSDESAYGPMALFHAAWGALAVTFVVLAAGRTFAAPWMWWAVGLFTAFWPPLVALHGYFSSEVPFATLLFASHWLWLRFVDSGRGGVLASLVSAAAFAIRPQVLLTVVLVAAWGVVRHRRLGVAAWARALTPWLLVLSFTSIRTYALTGQPNLISGNSYVGRFFADTEYPRLGSYPRGVAPEKREDRTGYFHPPARTSANGFIGDGFSFPGWRCDASVLEAERRRHLATRGLSYRLYLIRRNARFLAYDNPPWPERNEAVGWRQVAMETTDVVAGWALVPLAMLGLVGLAFRRKEPVTLTTLQAVTLLYSAAMYFAEQRYRIVYDPFLFVLALHGVAAVLGRDCGEPRPRSERVVFLFGLSAVILVLCVPWPGT